MELMNGLPFNLCRRKRLPYTSIIYWTLLTSGF